MKAPITDKFLWEIYEFFEKTGKTGDFLSSPSHRKLDVFLDLENPIFRKYKNEKNRKKFENAIFFLKKKNFIRVENLNNKKAVLLTKEGISRALAISFTMENKKEREDGKWIMLIFDIPEKYRKSRHLLRSILYDLGFKIFQKSVWISPYDVSEKLERALQTYSLDEYVKIFLIEKL